MSPINVKAIHVGDRVDLAAFALSRWWTAASSVTCTSTSFSRTPKGYGGPA